MSTVELYVALRREVLKRYPEYDVDAPDAERAIAEEADRAFTDLRAEEVLPGRALVLVWRAPSPFSIDAQRGLISLAPGDVGAVTWVGDRLREMKALFDPTLEIMLDAAHEPLLGLLPDAGLRPRMTLLHGAPGRALRRLREGGLDPAALGDLRLEPLREDEQIEQIVVLLRDVFGERPELGMLPPGMEVDAAVQARLDDMTRERSVACRESQTCWVVLDEDEVVGQVSVHVRRDPRVGLFGGLSIGLRPRVRGRGIGKLLYDKALEKMVELGVDTMRGRTANPRVLHLAQRMGREVRGWQLERA